MVSFTLSLIALILGYVFYGRLVEKVFSPDDRPTPAVSMADGMDYKVMSTSKIFMVQFLNIAGTGPIFGAVLGAKFGPASYLWIVLGCIFAGAVHDYLSGMLSMRNGGRSLPAIIGIYLGKGMEKFMTLFIILLLVIVGTVFVYSPAEILKSFCGTGIFWVIVIFAYYLIATVLPIDKVIGRIYPLFAAALLFMALGLMVMLFVKSPNIPEIWDGVNNWAPTADPNWKEQLFPCLFITIACGAISGFHATQSPMMARCMASEHQGRRIFYGAMITEGLVALVWAAVASYFFYGDPAPGYELIGAEKGFATSAPQVVNLMCNEWLGVVGGILALLGVVAAPISTGDTAFRSARLIVADFIHMEQKTVYKRFAICIPLFAAGFILLWWQMENPNGFQQIWQYFGLTNQSLGAITLWAITVYLVRSKKMYLITLLPALFMTVVCTSYLFLSFKMDWITPTISYMAGGGITVILLIWFMLWKSKFNKQYS